MVLNNPTTFCSKRERERERERCTRLKQIDQFNRYGPVQGCIPLATTGSLPKFWDWLSNATDAGKAQFMNSVVEIWAGKDAVSTLHVSPLIVGNIFKLPNGYVLTGWKLP